MRTAYQNNQQNMMMCGCGTMCMGMYTVSFARIEISVS